MIEQVPSLPGVDEPPPEEQSAAAAVIEPPKLKADPPPPPAQPTALDRMAARIDESAEQARQERLSEVEAASKAWRLYVARLADGEEISAEDSNDVLDAGQTLGISPKEVSDAFRRDVEALQTFRAYKAELSRLQDELPSLREKAVAAREELKRLPKIGVELRKEISRMEGAIRRIGDLQAFEILRVVREHPRLGLSAE